MQVTRNGRDHVVLLAAEDHEAMEATFGLLTDPEAMRRVRRSEAEIEAGDVLDEMAVQALLRRDDR